MKLSTFVLLFCVNLLAGPHEDKPKVNKDNELAAECDRQAAKLEALCIKRPLSLTETEIDDSLKRLAPAVAGACRDFKPVLAQSARQETERLRSDKKLAEVSEAFEFQDWVSMLRLEFIRAGEKPSAEQILEIRKLATRFKTPELSAAMLTLADAGEGKAEAADLAKLSKLALIQPQPAPPLMNLCGPFPTRSPWYIDDARAPFLELLLHYTMAAAPFNSKDVPAVIQSVATLLDAADPACGRLEAQKTLTGRLAETRLGDNSRYVPESWILSRLRPRCRNFWPLAQKEGSREKGNAELPKHAAFGAAEPVGTRIFPWFHGQADPFDAKNYRDRAAKQQPSPTVGVEESTDPLLAKLRSKPEKYDYGGKQEAIRARMIEELLAKGKFDPAFLTGAPPSELEWMLGNSAEALWYLTDTDPSIRLRNLDIGFGRQSRWNAGHFGPYAWEKKSPSAVQSAREKNIAHFKGIGGFNGLGQVEEPALRERWAPFVAAASKDKKHLSAWFALIHDRPESQGAWLAAFDKAGEEDQGYFLANEMHCQASTVLSDELGARLVQYMTKGPDRLRDSLRYRLEYCLASGLKSPALRKMPVSEKLTNGLLSGLAIAGNTEALEVLVAKSGKVGTGERWNALAFLQRVLSETKNEDPKLRKVVNDGLADFAKLLRDPTSRELLAKADWRGVSHSFLLSWWPKSQYEDLKDLLPHLEIYDAHLKQLKEKGNYTEDVRARLIDAGTLPKTEWLHAYPADKAKRLAEIRKVLWQNKNSQGDVDLVLRGLEGWWPELSKGEKRIVLEGWIARLKRTGDSTSEKFSNTLSNEAMKSLPAEQALRLIPKVKLDIDDEFVKLVEKELKGPGVASLTPSEKLSLQNWYLAAMLKKRGATLDPIFK